MPRPFAALVALVAVVSPVVSRAQGTDAPERVAFRATMDGLAGALTTLLPEALDRRPLDATRAARITAGVTMLDDVTRELARLHGAGAPDADPTIDVIFGELLRSVALARSCLGRYERATTELFGGTGGVTLPPEQQKRLTTLRSLAR